MRRIIALTSAAALALVLSPMREAHANHFGGHLNANLSSPGDGSVFLNRDSTGVSFSVNVADAGAVSIRSVRVTINGPGGGTACESSYPLPQDPQSLVVNVSGSFSWNTAAGVGGTLSCDADGASLPSGGPVANGDYTVSLTATAENIFTNETQNAGDSSGVTTGHAPVAPSGVTAARSGSDIVVSWNANPEPDIRDYVVSECQSGLGEACSDWQDISTVPASVRSVAVPSAGEGNYAYRVAARRNGAGEPRMSAFTASSPSSISIDEPAPEPDRDRRGGGGGATGRGSGSGDDVATDDGDDLASSGSGSLGSALPQRRIVRAAPSVVSSPDDDDRGFDELLPYASGGDTLPDGGEGGGADQRAVLIPLAGGALLLVLSGMAWYANRRFEMGIDGLPVEELAVAEPFTEAGVEANGHGNGYQPAYGGGHVTTFRSVPEDDAWQDDDAPLVGAAPRRH